MMSDKDLLKLLEQYAPMPVRTFIELADKNLYEAKTSGRNRTIGCKNTG
jgi:PleD family two-component response regulator